MPFNPDHLPPMAPGPSETTKGLSHTDTWIDFYARQQLSGHPRATWNQVVDTVIEEAIDTVDEEVKNGYLPNVKIPTSANARKKSIKEIRHQVVESTRYHLDFKNALVEFAGADETDRIETSLKMFRRLFYAYRSQCPDWDEGELFDAAERFVVDVEIDHRMNIEWEQSQKVD